MSTQVMSFLFWGGSMVLRQCFRLGDGNIFIAHVFLVFFSADEEKKHVYALEYFVDVWFFSLLRFGASLMCNSVVAWYLCATICYAWCLRNWCLWQHLRRVMSLRNYCYAWCLRNWCLWQHQHLSTLLQGKYRVIAETCQMTMNYVLLRWARLFSQRRITFSMTQNGPYWDRKTWTFIEGSQ